MNSLFSLEEQKNSRIKVLEDKSNLMKNFGEKQAKIENYNQQLNQYKNLVVTTQQPTYSELFITKQNQPIGIDPKLHQLGLLNKHLLEIADAENAKYLYDQLVQSLSEEQIKILNSKWIGFITELKKNYEKGLDKDVFINFVIEYLSKKDVNEAIAICQPSIIPQELIYPKNQEEITALINTINDSYKGEGCINMMQQYLKDNFNFIPNNINARGIVLKMTILKLFQQFLINKLSTSSIIGKGQDNKKSRIYKKEIQFISGGGCEPLKIIEKDEKYMKLQKYMINLDELEKSNLLVVKYIKNRQILPNLHRQKVSNEMKELILELCKNNNFEKDKFDLLTIDDQKLFMKFITQCKIDIGYEMVDEDKKVNEFDQQYQYLLSEWKKNNSNSEIKKELRKLLIKGADRNIRVL